MKSLEQLVSRFEWLLIALLIMLAVVVRYYALSDLMPFTYDQGRDLLKLQEISRGDLSLVGPTTGIGGVFLGPFYYYILLPGFFLGGGNPVAVMYWQTLWCTASLLLVYLILRRLTQPGWALLGLLLFVISPGSINEARVIWNPSWAVPTLLVSWYCLFRSKDKPFLLIPAAVAYAISLQTELAYTIFLAPAYACWTLWFSPLLEKWSQRNLYSWKTILLALLLAWSTLAPQVLFELKNNFIMTRSYVTEITTPERKTTLQQVWKYRPHQIAETMQERLWGQRSGSFYFFVAFLVLVLYTSTQKKLLAEERFLIASFILPILGLLLHTGNNGFFFPYYLNPHYMPGLLVLVIGLTKLPLKPFFVSICVGIAVAAFWHISQIIYSNQVLQYSYGRQIDALRYAREHATQPNYAIEVFVPNLLPVQYRYLNEYLGNSRRLSPADFFRHEHPEYFLIYEIAQDDGSRVAFKEWYKRHTEVPQARCEYQTQIGIITIEQCFLPDYNDRI